MSKQKKFRITGEVEERVRQCGSVNYPLLDMCKMLHCSIDDFSGSEKLMDVYRTAQLETALTIRLKLLSDLVETGDVKTAKIFLDNFSGQILPDPKDIEE